MRSADFLKFCLLALGFQFCGAAYSQGSGDSYPSKPVSLVLPFGPGGPTDIETRLYASKAHELLGQPFIIDYKPGAATTIGTAQVARAAPDGYTLLVATPNFVIFPSFYKALPFDTIRDFAPVTLMSEHYTVLMVRPAFPAKTFAEYIAYARANPGKINEGTAGIGGTLHLALAWIHNDTGTKVTYIHYKGAPQAMVDLQAGLLDVMMSNIASGVQLMKEGKVRALAITNSTRARLLPDLPTIAEQGIPGYDISSWQGLVAPGATPPAIINKLSETFVRVAKSADVSRPLEPLGASMVGSTPAQFKQVIVADTARWRKVIQETGIKLEE